MNRGQGWKTPRGQGSRIGKNNNIFAIVPIPMPTTSNSYNITMCRACQPKWEYQEIFVLINVK